MSPHYTSNFLRHIRNDIPIDEVIVDLLNLEVKNNCQMLRFRCPLCFNFHTATDHRTNLARCFDCSKNFNPIDMVIMVVSCNFVEAVEAIKDKFE